jgi:hypothetical protein
MSNFITLAQGIAMTKKYREEKDRILDASFRGKELLPISETFDRASFEALLAETDCSFIRVYLGMSEDLKIRIIAVGADAKDQDILPIVSSPANRVAALDGGGNIIEDGIRCPPNCPPPSPLNGS